jgi:hypothetical protein
MVGRLVGVLVGRFVGALVGRLVGEIVGGLVGDFDGGLVGVIVGGLVIPHMLVALGVPWETHHVSSLKPLNGNVTFLALNDAPINSDGAG